MLTKTARRRAKKPVRYPQVMPNSMNVKFTPHAADRVSHSFW